MRFPRILVLSCAPVLLVLAMSTGPASAQQQQVDKRTAGSADLTPVKDWIAKSTTIKTLSADFRQERHLRTVKKPLESTGRVWIQVGGAFRWQVGDPPKLLAILDAKGGFTVINETKKAAEIFPAGNLESREAAQSLAFLRAGFPADLEDFQKKFEILAITPDGDWDRVELKPAGQGNSFAVVKMGMYLHRRLHTLGSMQVYLRDGSWIDTRFTAVQENPVIPESLLRAPDLSAYKLRRN